MQNHVGEIYEILVADFGMEKGFSTYHDIIAIILQSDNYINLHTKNKTKASTPNIKLYLSREL